MTGADGTIVTAQSLIGLRAAVIREVKSDHPVSPLPGGFAIRKRGQGQVIADSRLYMHGDDMRHVDKGATARTGTLHIRTFHEEKDRITFLVADFRPSMLWGMQRAFRSVAAAEALAWLGWQAVETGGRVGLLAITGDRPEIIRTQGGTRGMLAAIGGLVRAHAAAMTAAQSGRTGGFADPPLDTTLTGLHRIVPKGARIVIASALDSLGPEFDRVIGALAQHRPPHFLVIEDSALNDLPAGRYPLRGADGRRRTAWFQQTQAAHTGAADRVAGYPSTRVDAGRLTRDAMAGA